MLKVCLVMPSSAGLYWIVNCELKKKFEAQK